MSLMQYMKEQEELVILQKDDENKTKLADFIRTIDDLNDDRFKEFATDELGMSEDEAETIVFKMLKDFLLTNDKDEDGIPDDLLDDELGEEPDVESDVESDDGGLGLGESDELDIQSDVIDGINGNVDDDNVRGFSSNFGINKGDTVKIGKSIILTLVALNKLISSSDDNDLKSEFSTLTKLLAR